MGRPHARAYADSVDFEIVGIVTRRRASVPAEFGSLPYWSDYAAALAATGPDLVVISTYSETHADFAIAAMEAGAHVFVEKPLATNVADAERVVAAARRLSRKLLVGYILRHHPLWQRLVAEARGLGGPYVFRIALNQPSAGPAWETHKQLMQTVSPIVDCGVHYVDVMAQISDAPAREVRGMGLRLTGEIAPDMYNYGQFQLLFADSSLGWFETGWGPMISAVGQTIMDIVTPAGALSLVEDANGSRSLALRRLGADRAEIVMAPGPMPRDLLCAFQRDYMARVMREDIDLSGHLDDAVQSLRICLAAETSIARGEPVLLAAP
ncbi:MAG: oxidoreductase [Pelagibacterium sp. SCN 63-23]|nr:MAG: oxidoreductase [Pelagibacterium sp. SCN 63-23]